MCNQKKRHPITVAAKNHPDFDGLPKSGDDEIMIVFGISSMPYDRQIGLVHTHLPHVNVIIFVVRRCATSAAAA
jgi:hypothetical protein